MENKMTAVEWQFEELQKAEKNWKNETIDGIEYTKIKYEILEKTLELEKQQIMKSNRDGVDMVLEGKPFLTAEQYYNETFKK